MSINKICPSLRRIGVPRNSPNWPSLGLMCNNYSNNDKHSIRDHCGPFGFEFYSLWTCTIFSDGNTSLIQKNPITSRSCSLSWFLLLLWQNTLAKVTHGRKGWFLAHSFRWQSFVSGEVTKTSHVAPSVKEWRARDECRPVLCSLSLLVYN